MNKETFDFLIKIVEILAPFGFALIIFNLTQKREEDRWQKDSFVKRKQEIYIDFYDKLLDLKNNLSYLIDDYFVYTATNFSDTVPNEMASWGDHIDFDQERHGLSEEIRRVLSVIKDYSFSYRKFVIYFYKQSITDINKDQMNHFVQSLGTVESFVSDLDFLCIAKTEDKSTYYYNYDDFTLRLNKIRCSGRSVLDALDSSGLIEYLEKEVII